MISAVHQKNETREGEEVIKKIRWHIKSIDKKKKKIGENWFYQFLQNKRSANEKFVETKSYFGSFHSYMTPSIIWARKFRVSKQASEICTYAWHRKRYVACVWQLFEKLNINREMEKSETDLFHLLLYLLPDVVSLVNLKFTEFTDWIIEFVLAISCHPLCKINQTDSCIARKLISLNELSEMRINSAVRRLQLISRVLQHPNGVIFDLCVDVW